MLNVGLRQPPNRIAHNEEEALVKAEEIGLSVGCPSFAVLGGRAMQIDYSAEELQKYMREADKFRRQPCIARFFLNNAIEVDVDCVSDGQDVVIGGIMQHVEQAGIHPATPAVHCLHTHWTKKFKTKSAVKPKPWHTHWAWSA